MPAKDTKLQWPNKVLAGLQETVADMIAEPDRQVVLQKAVERTAELVGADIATIHIYDPLTSRVRAAAEHGVRNKKTFHQHELGRGKAALWVVSKGEPVIAEDVSASELKGPFSAREGVQSAAGFPLKVSDKVIGVLFVNYREPHKFEPEEIKTLISFGNLASVAIDAAGLYEQAEARAQTIRHLGEVGQSLTTLQESPEVLQKTLERIANLAMQVLGADVVDLYQYRADKDEFVLPPIMVGDRRFPHLIPTQVFPDDVVVQIAHTGEKVYASDAQEHLVLAGDWELPREERPEKRFVLREGIISSAAVSIKVGEEVVGVVFAGYRQRRDFDTDVELREKIEVLANQGAVAIHNARLLDRLRKQIQTLAGLHEVTQSLLITQDLSQLLQQVAESALQVLDADVVTLYEYDQPKDEFVTPPIVAGELKDPVPMRTKIYDDDVVARIVRQKKASHYASNAPEDKFLLGEWVRTVPARNGLPERPRFVYREDVQSSAGVLLKVDEETVGIMFVSYRSPRLFEQEERTAIELFAHQAATAIRNARLFQELDERATQLEQLQAVTAAISAEPPNLEKVSLLIVSSLSSIFHEASCAIRLYNSTTDQFRAQIATGVMEDWIDCLPRPDGTSRYGVQTKTPRYLEENDVATPSDEGPAVREDILALGIKAVAYLPLVSRGDVVGVLYVNLTVPHRFSDNDKLLLELFADQAAIAIENARLYQDLERRIQELEVLSGIYEKIIKLGVESVDKILDLIYSETSKVMDLRNAQVQIVFYDEAKDEVSFPLAIEQDGGIVIDIVRWSKREAQYREAGEDEVVEQFKPRARGKRFGLTEYVIREKKPVLIPEDFVREAESRRIQVWPTFGRLDRPTHSWLGVPMIVQDWVIGIISVQSLEVEHAFDRGHVELLSTIANQAAVAIENASLYAEMEQRIRERTRQLREAQQRRIEAERFAYLGHAADGIAHRINNTVALLPLCVRDIKQHLATVDAVTDSNLEMIARNAQYVLDLAEELQKPSRPSEAGRFDINLLIKEAIDVARPPSEVEVVTKLDKTLPKVRTKKLVIDVFVELVTNAVKAMPGRAKRVLEISSRLTEDKYVEVWFTDTGKGIPEEERERLFELFYTTAEKKEPAAGVAKGFGLWWIKTFLAWQGGEISVESQVGIGTTFVVKLPIEVQ